MTGASAAAGWTGIDSAASEAGAVDRRQPRQSVPDAPDAAGCCRHRRVRQQAVGPRRRARPEPDGDGRRGDSQPVSPVRPHQRVQSGDGRTLRADGRRLRRQVRRPAVLRGHRRKPRRGRQRGASAGRRRRASPTPTSSAKDGCPDRDRERGSRPHGGRTTISSRSGSSIRICRRSTTPSSRPPGNFPATGRLSLLGLRSREITSITPDEETDGRAEIRSRNDLITATLVSPLARALSTSIIAWSRNTDLIDIEDELESSSESAPLTRISSPGSCRLTTCRCARRSGFRQSAATGWRLERSGIGCGRMWRSRPATTSIPSGCSAAAPCGWEACFRSTSIIRGAPRGAARGSRIASSCRRPSRWFPGCGGTGAV